MPVQHPFFSDERPIPNLFCRGGGWLPVALPWFNVSVEVWKKDRTHSEVLIIPTLEGLKQILEAQNIFLKVDTIDYVTPGDMNESGQWQMERLLELSELENAFGWGITRCKVEGGRIYRGLVLEHSDEWSSERLIFSQEKCRELRT